MPKARPKSLSRITSLGFPAWPWSCSDTSTFLTRLCSAPAREKGTFSNFLKSTGVQTHPEQSCGTWEATDKNPNMGKGRNREADGWISYNPSFPPAQDTSCNPRDVPVPAGAQECQPWIPTMDTRPVFPALLPRGIHNIPALHSHGDFHCQQ